ncbi:MAG: UxaA family hydrolase, partial [Thiotrichales bacterium]|nr:UxaA family hydrolase [Thiotrichales bacterium]
DPALAGELRDAVRKAERYHRDLGHGSFGGGNIKYGLSTLEEKSLGAYAKSGTRPIAGLLKPGVRPPRPGLYLMDTVNDGEVRLPSGRVHHRRRIGGRTGRRPFDQGCIQHPRLPAHGR